MQVSVDKGIIIGSIKVRFSSFLKWLVKNLFFCRVSPIDLIYGFPRQYYTFLVYNIT